MAKYTIQIEVEVTQGWVDDGFNPETDSTKEAIQEAVLGLLPWAAEWEFTAKVSNVKKHKHKWA